MKIGYAVVVAIASAAFATACSKAEAPTGPVAAAGVNAASPEAVVTPPVTKAPEVPLPPLPSDISAPTHAPGPDPTPPEQPTGRDTQANDPKGDLTAAQESKEMPKANQANNHSSTALDKEQPQ